MSQKEDTGALAMKKPETAQVANIHGVDKLQPPKTKEETEASNSVSPEKATHAGDDSFKRSIHDASYVGWKQIGGWEEKDELTLNDELMDMSKETFLNNIIPDNLYGDWYHSVAIFFIGGVLSFALGHYKFSMGSAFFVIVITSLLYRTSAKKYRGSIRELVQKEFTVQKVENDYESLEWLNTFLDKYWPILEPSMSQIIVQQANEQMATNEAIPKFITELWVDQLTLGIKPPRIDLVKTFQNTASDVVVMDWGLSFTPHDLCDMSAKQVRNYVNELIVIKAKIFGFTIPISVSDVAFKAHARVKFKLMTPFPHVETVNVQLLKVPDFDFVASLLGRSIFNWEVLAIPGLMTLIQKMAKKYVGPILLPPFSLQLNIPQILSGSNLSIGILEITVKNAKGLRRTTSVLNQSIDPYLSFEFNDISIAKTRTVRDTLNPVWDETLYVLLNSFTDPLTISVFDKRAKLKDKVLGRIQYNLNSLHDKSTQRNIKARFLRNSKPVGDLTFDLRFFPTLEEKKLPDGSVEELPDLNTGIAKIVVQEGSHFAEEDKKVTAYVEVYLNAKLVLTTGKASDTGTLKWNSNYEAVIADRRKTRYKFVVKDNNGEEIGSAIQTLNDLIDRSQVDKNLIPLKGQKGDIKITTYWKPVRLDIGSNSVAYTPPIGAIRVFIEKANDLRNLEKIGTIDPYCRVLVNGLSKGRTDFKSKTLNPVWNQVIYVAVTSPNQRITLQCMDVETMNKDRSVGEFNVNVQDLFKKDANDKYEEIIDEETKVGHLVMHKKRPKGTITYSTSFYPALPVLTLEEIQDLDKVNKKKKLLESRKSVMDEKKMSKEDKAKFEQECNEVKELEDMYSNRQKLDLQELLQYNQGVLAITVLDGELPDSGLYVQSFFDGNGHARFVSPQISSRIIKNGWSGDVIIKELDKSVTTFRVSKNKNYNKMEKCVCEVELPTLDLVKNCYYKPSILHLSGDNSAKLMLQISWFPIDTKQLPENDLITNSGDLTIISKSAKNLIASDLNGYSDPYLKFYINNEEDHVYKTKIVKKSLNPKWNDEGTIQINNRLNDTLRIKVMDWDSTSADDTIGKAEIPLKKIKAEGTTELDVPVEGLENAGQDGGMLHLEFSFKPRYTVSVCKREKKVTDIASKGLGTGLRAGTSVIGGGVGAIGKIKKGVFGGLGSITNHKKNHEKGEDETKF
ncbi:hypothetical protein SUVZ_08G1240 [Saccharomyces uvarum]|uniref:Tcb1p n=1 Tax=Saccharomyces uvarum TaxID=230603 RepID=A0ABN8WZK6_SACUV|nr:hypothetical protein SUVZ_08G1240 [Saccharomyces uvarum]